MKSLLSVLALGFALSAGMAQAADPAPAAAAPTKQQNKMATCNADAGDKKGDERKSFMKECLSAKAAPPAKVTQQDKMKTCNADAKTSGKKGDERKEFMKACLSNK